jgi:hypothetical protein
MCSATQMTCRVVYVTVDQSLLSGWIIVRFPNIMALNVTTMVFASAKTERQIYIM